MQVKPSTDLTTGYYLKKIIKRKVPLFVIVIVIDCMVFAPKDAYTMGKHFLHLFVCQMV